MREQLLDATSILADAGVPTPDVDARLLAAHVLGVSPMAVTFAEVDETFEERFNGVVKRRAQREPLQHITGTAPFGPLDLAVGPGVFIPRPETEVLADWAARTLAGMPAPTVVDMGTGSGALAIYVASHIPEARVYAVELSTTAREYAARNATSNGVRITLVDASMTDPQLLRDLDGAVDLVVANPPYVPETPDLEPEVYRDPPEAVFSGADGMDAIRGLVPVAQRLLRPGGWLGVEHDDVTSTSTCSVIEACGGFGPPTVLRDLAGRNRFVCASKL
ncbi:peptide chain release factor N(5)-glutamine methyltransferase [Corynebacterium godavarianum]|uniref:Release factor glutamine methyltransferase n=1 Tax=Corynebacterium godavarianum TaxID=2054421 RepID=A0ABY3E6R4_9CORY|nr:peptide chain release factor N(5)-glutamine methyltransferase [Corynebacterium godavarianum]MBL7285711.1 peptide chain release factor N(5)-glutamine methyltransferase [Corynebacterium godavarianum]TSJ75451.1 peptide chain release factor N(5)-glutamine methyltransferase [Corynebacterium godavarianum]